MASKTTVELIDDLTGESASETVTFAVDGVDYEIDLSEANAEKLRSALTTWVEKSRRVGGRAKRGSANANASASEAPKIRAWAKENGYAVPERGRIPSEIREAYESGTPAPKDDKSAEKPSDSAEKPAKAEAKPKNEKKAEAEKVAEDSAS